MFNNVVLVNAEARALYRTLTVRKLVNAVRLGLGYGLTQLTRRPHVWGLPLALSVEPTSACNLRCPECPTGAGALNRPHGMLDIARYRTLIDEIHGTTVYLNLYFQGEPTIHRQFTDLVRHAADRGIFVSTSTNGHFLSGDRAERIVASGLHRLVVSMDGTTQASYEKYRVGGSLQKVLDGLAALRDAKRKLGSRTPFVHLQFIVMGHNEGELDEIRRLADEYGVDKLDLKSAQVMDLDNPQIDLPQNPAFRRYEPAADGSLKLRVKMKNTCHYLWKSSVVTWDGTVAPCCFDKDAEQPMGSLADSGFIPIWRSEPYQRFRSKLLTDRANASPMCANCIEGLKVIVE